MSTFNRFQIWGHVPRSGQGNWQFKINGTTEKEDIDLPNPHRPRFPRKKKRQRAYVVARWHLAGQKKQSYLTPCSTAISAARSVFLSSITMVIGPTPPGTGEMAATRSLATSNSKSPFQT
jgi:hypothetical protein